ncbi:MAG: plasmid stabilization protein [Microgenomates group bacterium]
MYKIVFGNKFDQQLRNLTRHNRKYVVKIRKIVDLLEHDVDHPSLRLHKLSGTKWYSISVNKSIRILLSIEKGTIYLLKIGKHEEVY